MEEKQKNRGLTLFVHVVSLERDIPYTIYAIVDEV